jgi:hypothetical protein
LKEDVAATLGLGCKNALTLLLEKDPHVWEWKNSEGHSVLALLCRGTENGPTAEAKKNCLALFKKAMTSSDLLKDNSALKRELTEELICGCKDALDFLLNTDQYADVIKWQISNGRTVLGEICYRSEYGETEILQQKCREIFNINKILKKTRSDKDLRQDVANVLGEGCKNAILIISLLPKDGPPVLEWENREGLSVLESLCLNSANHSDKTKRLNCLDLLGTRSLSACFSQDTEWRKRVVHCLSQGCLEALKLVLKKHPNAWAFQDREGFSLLKRLCYNSEYGKDAEIRKNCLDSFLSLIAQMQGLGVQDVSFIYEVAVALCYGGLKVFDSLLNSSHPVWAWQDKNGQTVLGHLCYLSEYGEEGQKAKCLTLFNKALNSQEIKNNIGCFRAVSFTLGYGCRAAFKCLSKKYSDVLWWTAVDGNLVIERLCYFSEKGQNESIKANCLDVLQQADHAYYLQLQNNSYLRQYLARTLREGCPSASEVLLMKGLYFWQWYYQNRTVLQSLLEKESTTPQEARSPAFEAIKKIVECHNKFSGQTPLLTQQEINLIASSPSKRVQDLVRIIKRTTYVY